MSTLSGSSLAEARELYTTLSECMSLLDNVEKKSMVTRNELDLVITTIYSFLVLVNRLGLGGEYSEIISKISRLILMVNMLKTAIFTLYFSTPYGAVIGAVTAVSTILEGVTLFGELTQSFKGNKV